MKLKIVSRVALSFVFPLQMFVVVACGGTNGTSDSVGEGAIGPSGSGKATTSVTSAVDKEPYTDPENGVTYEMNPNRRILVGAGADESAGAVPEAEGMEKVRQVSQALNANGPDTDASGKVSIQIAECRSGTQTGSISVGCSVSSEYVLIGGGAQDVYTGFGAMLWESRPQDMNDNGTGTTWLASSKDHVNASSHTLTAWAVGLRLIKTNGVAMTHDELKAFVHYTWSQSSASHNPSVTCNVPVGSLVVGGGARSNYTGWGQLLTESYPQNSTTWLGSSKDNNQPDVASLNVYCVGIQSTIPNFGTLIIDRVSSTQFANSGVDSAVNNITNTPRSVAGCYGGQSSYNGFGRLLFRMSPGDGDIRGFIASSKDHLNADSGSVTAWATQLRKQ